MNASTQRAMSFAGQDRRRYCPGCGTLNVPTIRGAFVNHTNRNGKPCVYSGVSVDAANAEAEGHNRQTKIGHNESHR